MEHVKFSRKLLVCLLAGLIIAAVLRRVMARYFITLMPVTGVWGLSLLCLLVFWVYPFVWHWQEKRGKGNSPARLLCLQSLIAYTLAFDLASFGWQKIFHLQMVVPLGILDLPFNSLDGETLTWAYFRRSYPFTVTIAISQMVSAYLLLWPRTRLLGLICMIPILLNIIFIDFFYHLPVGVLLHAIILMSGVIYLLMQYRTSLVHFFFRTLPAAATTFNRPTMYLLRAAVILIPLVLLATYNYPDKHPQFTGKYMVSHLTVNGRPVVAHSTKDSVLTSVYMDWQDDFVLEFNNYNNRYIGTYSYAPETDSLHVQWRYPAAFNMPFSGSLKKTDKRGDYSFIGYMGTDTLEMRLERLPEPR
ncbi:hypothetical protein [Chitinophaga ginsengisoli]|uniref:Uncharacterized protein n=1 Tax=Chitinophaga ginsengisoli TaxID=363837 RepID=A0A2P8GLT3_9BACT|nr:hypothetical protein [Chitinophaga ginsengisoli]PSL34931.1 hypothetical protein CLV42_102505 [Chitinophaga ginsengisoli]